MAFDFENLEAQIKERGSMETLENGATLITENIPGSGLVKARLAMHVGSDYEEPEEYGTLHFLEHMAFNGSRLYPDRFKRNVEAGAVGLGLNARTGNTMVTFPVGGKDDGYMLPKNFVQGFRMMSDMAFFPLLTEELLQKERDIIQRERVEGEINLSKDKEKGNRKEVEQRLYSSNPLLLKENILCVGTSESISNMSLEKLREFHSKYFVGKNTLARVIGDLNGNGSKSPLVDMAKEMLMEVPAGEMSPPIEYAEEKPFQGKETIIQKSDFPQNKEVLMYFNVPSFQYKESYALNPLKFILGGDFNGMLFNDLREEKQLVYSLGCGTMGHMKTGYFFIHYTVESEKLDLAMKATESCLSKVKQGLFDEKSMEAFRAAYIPMALEDFQKPRWIEKELRERYDQERFGYQSTSLERLKGIFNVTKQDVVEAANKYLGENRLVVIK